MKVRELISNLLDYDMEATVEILVESKEDSFDTNDFEIEENKLSFNNYLTLKVVPDGHVAVDEASYEDIKQDLMDSNSLVESMTSTMEQMEQQIFELEQK